MSDFKIDFCGVGAAKAGTTWVAVVLQAHPQTCVGKRKELNFFMYSHPLENIMKLSGSHYDTVNWNRGIEWYEQQFAHCRPGMLKGELSTSYLGLPESPRLLKEHNPDIKIIMNYRNPADALYSDYFQLNEMHPIHEPFEVMLGKYDEGYEYYSFAKHTKRYLEYFDREQIMFIFLDDIKSNANKVYSDLCTFLGIDEIELHVVNQRVNPSKMIRSKTVRDGILHLYRLFDKYESLRRFRTWTRETGVSRVMQKIRNMNSVVQKYPPLKPETRAIMIERFRDDIKELEKLHNRDLSHWLTVEK